MRMADLRLRTGSGALVVRVRWPSTAGAPPALLFFPDLAPDGGVDHADDLLCQELCARREMVVLCAPWALRREGAPGPVLDRAALALDWCADHAGELGADPERLVVAGRGAGAAVAAALVRRAREDGWPQITGQLLIDERSPDDPR